MQTYRAALVGCSRMGAFIDNEVAGSPSIVLPYSHAAGYEACSRTSLVAGSDLRPDVLSVFGERYGISPDHQYTDYREMILSEQPDILSIATQPQHRTEIALFAIEHGVRALYCEKPFCASVAEAEAISRAVEKHGVVFNMGTNRRWHPGYTAMRHRIASGDIGALKTLIVYANGTLFNTSSHWFDLLLYLNGDVPVAWVQAFLPRGDEILVGDSITEDPTSQGTIAFTNGVMAHLLLSPRPFDPEAIGERGTISASARDSQFKLRRLPGERRDSDLSAPEVIPFEPASSTLRLIEDIVQALDTGQPTRGGVQIARVNTEIIFGFVQSHRLGGARVALPLRENSLRFAPHASTPKQPRYTV